MTQGNPAKIHMSLIEDMPLFAGISGQDRTVVLECCISKFAACKDVIFNQGDAVDYFFLLLDGYIQVVKTTPLGEQVIMRHMVCGDIFGIAPALSRTTYPATACAVADCVMLCWPVKYWDIFAHDYPLFVQNIYKMMGQRLDESQDRIVELATEQVERRIAKSILRLIEDCGVETPGGISLDIPMSRQDIAQMSGTTLYTVSRVFSNWGNKNIISAGRKSIEIYSQEQVQDIAQQTLN